MKLLFSIYCAFNLFNVFALCDARDQPSDSCIPALLLGCISGIHCASQLSPSPSSYSLICHTFTGSAFLKQVSLYLKQFWGYADPIVREHTFTSCTDVRQSYLSGCGWWPLLWLLDGFSGVPLMSTWGWLTVGIVNDVLDSTLWVQASVHSFWNHTRETC